MEKDRLFPLLVIGADFRKKTFAFLWKRVDSALTVKTNPK